MVLDLREMGLRKLGKGMGLWNFVWSIEEREREVAKNLRDMGEKNGKRSSQYHNTISIQSSTSSGNGKPI